MAGRRVSTVDASIEDKVMKEPCAVCCLSGDEDDCLLCDSCDMAMHYNCVGLSSIPAGDWSCPWCLKKTVVASSEVTANLLRFFAFFEHISFLFHQIIRNRTHHIAGQSDFGSFQVKDC
jgi:hypothetical protein